MAKLARQDPKLSSLEQRHSLHPHATKVVDDLFHGSDFFDRRDLLQVKYEMLRRVRVEGASITQTSTAFGLSRPSYYEAQTAFARDGLPGLLPKKRGPRRAYKMSAAVIAFLHEQLAADTSLRAPELARRLHERFGLTVHPRSIERALEREGKASRTPGTGGSAPARPPRPRR